MPIEKHLQKSMVALTNIPQALAQAPAPAPEMSVLPPIPIIAPLVAAVMAAGGALIVVVMGRSLLMVACMSLMTIMFIRIVTFATVLVGVACATVVARLIIDDTIATSCSGVSMYLGGVSNFLIWHTALNFPLSHLRLGCKF